MHKHEFERRSKFR